MLTRIPGVALISLCIGCGAGPAHDATATVRDSAGVEIVESRLPEPGAGPTFSSSPMIDLGGDENEVTFYGVMNVVPLADGSFIVADNGSRALRQFDRTGRPVRTVGGEGDGPGEFRFISWLQRLPGDTLAVYDPRNQRVSLLDGDVEFIGVLDFRAPRRAVTAGALAVVQSSLTGLFHDRTGLVHGSVAFPATGREGLHTLQGEMLRHRFVDGIQDTLLHIEFTDYHEKLGDMPPVLVPTFAARLRTAVAGERVALTTGRSYEVRIYDANGGLERIARATGDPAPVTAEHRAAHAAAAPPRPGAPEPVYAELLPTYGEILSIGEEVWALEFVPPPDTIGSAHVYDGGGVLSAVIPLPPRFTLHGVRDGRAYGVYRDPLGVERVQVYDVNGLSY